MQYSHLITASAARKVPKSAPGLSRSPILPVPVLRSRPCKVVSKQANGWQLYTHLKQKERVF